MLVQDLRYASRMLRSRPLSAAVAVLSLALGIGANTAVFTIADEVLWRNLPVRAPEELVSVTGADIDTYPAYKEFRDRNTVFDSLAASSPNLKAALRAGNGEAEVVQVRLVSGNFFSMLGVGAAVGRTIGEDDDRKPGAGPVAAIGYGLWTRRFARAPTAVGKLLTMNGSSFRIVGVVEPEFQGIQAGQETDVYLPLQMTAQVFPTLAPVWSRNGMHWLWAMGRLKPGVDASQAQAALNVLAPQVAEAVQPGRLPHRQQVEVIPGAQGTPFARRSLESTALVLMGATGFVLLIACVNVANLWLAGAPARRREFAIREALGASRWRLVRQLFTESAVIAVLGGAAGVLAAFWLADFLSTMIGGVRGPFVVRSPLALRVLGFTTAISFTSAVLSGLVPAWRASRSSVAEAMRPAGISPTGERRLGTRMMVGAQVALSVILLAGAGLFARTLGSLRQIDPGFRAGHVLLVEVKASELGYRGQRLRMFYDRLLERARAHPGVVAASLASLTPLSGARRTTSLTGEGFRHPPGKRPEYFEIPVSSGYFTTLEIPFLSGRDFRSEDDPAVASEGGYMGLAGATAVHRGASHRPRPVAIVSESLARHFFGTANALGRRISPNEEFWPEGAYEIVGVVKDVRYTGLRQPPEYALYTPNWIQGSAWRTLAVRTSGDPRALATAVRADVRTLDAGVPVESAITLEEQVNQTISTQRLLAQLSVAFGGVAMLLAAIGLYGVLAQRVARRTKEIGIRIALGADGRSVLAMVMRESAFVALGGVTAGLAGAALLTRWIEGSLYGVKPLDPLSFLGAGLLLLAVCLTAAWVPARRAAAVHPLAALRYE